MGKKPIKGGHSKNEGLDSAILSHPRTLILRPPLPLDSAISSHSRTLILRMTIS
jgi:hypothetical protein